MAEELHITFGLYHPRNKLIGMPCIIAFDFMTRYMSRVLAWLSQIISCCEGFQETIKGMDDDAVHRLRSIPLLCKFS